MAETDIEDQIVLITGGAGFVGSHLVDALIDDNDVRILDDFSNGNRERLPNNVDVYEGDVRDEDLVTDAIENVDTVFHEAAMVDVQQSIKHPHESRSVNVDGTLTVLEAAKDTHARVVVASSAAVYGLDNELPITEASVTTPLSPYGLDKLTIDHYTRLYHDLYDVDAIALRYFNIYGPRQTAKAYSGVIGVFTEQAIAGEPLTVHGEGTQTRDFISVEDIVRANCLAATVDVSGVSVNVGTGSNITIRELAELIADITDSDSEITHVDRPPGDVDQSRADISRARELLGYEPEVSLRDGLREFVDWYRETEI